MGAQPPETAIAAAIQEVTAHAQALIRDEIELASADRLLIGSIQSLDRPVIVAYLVMIVLMFVVINLVVDILYSILDPRGRLGEQGA